MRPHAIVRDSRGNYLVAHGDGAGAAKQIWVFGPDGGFLRTIGGEGEGPGEYRSISRIFHFPGDTLEIFDGALRRKTRLSPEFEVLETQSSFEVRSFFHAVRLPDGKLVLNEHLRTEGRLGFPLQFVDEGGKIVRSFGSVDPEYRRREPVKYQRITMPGPEPGTVWSLGRGDYLLELWDTAGTRHKVLERKPGWFEPFVADFAITPDGPPPPTWIRLAKSDPRGLVWVFATVPADDWRKSVAANPDVGTDLSALMGLYDWVLEVLDPETSTVIASTDFPKLQFVSFLGEDMVVTYREDKIGYPFLDIWRLRLVER